jgi:hypothetical protein
MTAQPAHTKILASEAPLRVSCLCEPPLPPAQSSYLEHLGVQLKSPVRIIPGRKETRSIPLIEPGDLDLLVYCEPDRPWWQRWLGWTPAIGLMSRTRASVWLVRQPRWPLKRILLILRGHESDYLALHWLDRLVRPKRTELFALPIIPPVPAMYRHDSLPLLPGVLLGFNAVSVPQLSDLAKRCAGWGINGTLLLHDQAPRRRIEWAMAASDPDLILIGAEPFPWIQRRLFGELERPLLGSADRPVLVAQKLQPRSG